MIAGRKAAVQTVPLNHHHLIQKHLSPNDQEWKVKVKQLPVRVIHRLFLKLMGKR